MNNDGNFSSERTPFLARNTFRLPANVSFDPRISRKIRVREGMQLELFGEAFNIFNRFNYFSANFNQLTVATATANPVTSPCGFGTPNLAKCLRPVTANATGFGMPREVIGAQPVQRVLQLGTKFTF